MRTAPLLLLLACTRTTTVTTADTGDAEGCAEPVPAQTTLSAEVFSETGVRFYVPDARWALATAHASRQVRAVSHAELDLSPSWFFAQALDASFMGCAEDIPADPDDPNNTYDGQTAPSGCFGLPESTVWLELCRLYPDELDCPDGYAEAVLADASGDRVPSSAMALGWFTVVAHALLQRHGTDDPDAWLAAAEDPRALEKVLALGRMSSPWEPDLDVVIEDCDTGPIEACVEEPAFAERLAELASHTADLEASVAGGACYDEPLTGEAVEAYVAELARLWPDARVTDAIAAGLAALDEGAGFQSTAPAVIDAIDAELGVSLSCPGAQLGEWYALECP